MFKGFKPQGLQKIANSMGYTGSLEGFDSYLQQNPDKQNMMNMYNQRAMQMAQGGAVRRMREGGVAGGGGVNPNNVAKATLGGNMIPEGERDRTGVLQETKRAYGTKPINIMTQAVGEDGNMADAIARPVGATRAMGEDGTGPRPLIANRPVATTRAVGEDGNWGDAIAKTMAVGEDDPNFEQPKLTTMAYGEEGEPPLEPPIFDRPPQVTTEAQGEEGETVPPTQLPIAKTMAVGEDDGDMGGKLIGRLPPDMPPDLAKQLRRGGEDFPPFQPPIAKTMAAGEDDGGLFPIDPRQPQPLPQQYIPQIDDQYLGVPEEGADPYVNYRQNVETFPETGTFKNPAIQAGFDTMQEELSKELAPTPAPEDLKRRSDAILDYVQNIYSGPLYREDGKTFTEEFKQYAKDSGISVDGSLLNVQEGSPFATIPGYIPPAPATGGSIGDITGKLAFNPALPEGATATAVGIGQSPDQMLKQGTGQVSGTVSVPTAMASTTMAEQPGVTDANLMTPEAVAGQVNSSLDSLQAAQTDPNDPRAKVLAAQQTKSAVSDLNAAQGSATLMENPVQREIQDGELISGAADAQKAAKFAEQIQAATATPSEKATVQGQLAQLTQNFDANNPPPWAAGALRGIQGQLAARGLGASSIAGQALIQGALESALPIAQADAQTQAQFESQNLSNRQQRAMLAAQQRAQFIGQEFDQAFQARVQNSARIGDIANMNFTAEQNIALENSRAVNTMNLQNLNNSQSMVMAEASALANMDMANLNNRQQAAVQNAQSFLQMDMANLSNQQQTNHNSMPLKQMHSHSLTQVKLIL